jgi:MFS family permease
MMARRGGLWKRPDFLNYWAAQAISQLGSQVTLLAIPLLAVLTLRATPWQMGILAAAETAPFLLTGLIAGVWADRRRRRPMLIAADLGRGGLLLLVPVAAWAGRLRMEHLYAIGFLIGVLTVFFEVAAQSYLPSLVPRERLVDANGKLQTTRSMAQVAGPGLAGVLVQAASAPVAILLDAASFFLSALGLGRIRASEPAPAAHRDDVNLWREIAEGCRVVAHNPILRAFAGKVAVANLGFQVLMTVFVLYATRDLGLDAAHLGLVFAAGSVGSLLGALLAEQTARRYGIGPAIVGCSMLAALGLLIVPLVDGPPAVTVPLLVGALCLDGLGSVLADVHMLSVQQAITPDRLQGRVNATTRFLTWGILPLGGIVGGALGTTIGLRLTIGFGVAAYLLSIGWLIRSPVGSLRAAPESLVPPVLSATGDGV